MEVLLPAFRLDLDREREKRKRRRMELVSTGQVSTSLVGTSTSFYVYISGPLRVSTVGTVIGPRLDKGLRRSEVRGAYTLFIWG